MKVKEEVDELEEEEEVEEKEEEEEEEGKIRRKAMNYMFIYNLIIG